MSRIWKAGTATVTNGSTAVTGVETGWQTALVEGGLFVFAGINGVLESVESETAATLAVPWPGPSGSGQYFILREWSEAVRQVWQTDRLAKILTNLAVAAVAVKGAGTEAERNALDPQPVYDIGNPWIWLRFEAGKELALSQMTASGWSAWRELPAGADGDDFTGNLGDLTDVTISTPVEGDVLRRGPAAWTNYTASGWTPVSVVSNEAVFDVSAHDKFLLTVDDDCEIQLPTNPIDGAPFILRIVMDGDHTVTFEAGWEGDLPEILQTDGDETVIGGMVLDSSPSVRVFVNLIKSIPAS